MGIKKEFEKYLLKKNCSEKKEWWTEQKATENKLDWNLNDKLQILVLVCA